MAAERIIVVVEGDSVPLQRAVRQAADSLRGLNVTARTQSAQAAGAIEGSNTRIVHSSKLGREAVATESLIAGRWFGYMARRAILAGGGVAAAYTAISGAENAIKSTVDLGISSEHLARNLGLSIEQASRWEAVAKARGIDNNQLNTTFGHLSQAVSKASDAITGQGHAEDTLARLRRSHSGVTAELIDNATKARKGSLEQLSAINLLTAAHGPLDKAESTQLKAALRNAEASKTQLDALTKLGFSHADIIRSTKDFDFFTNKLAEGFGNYKGGADRAALATALLGRNSKDILPLFEQGRKSLDANLQLADKYGVTLHGKTVKNVHELEQAQRELKFAQMGLQIQITEKLAPTLLSLASGAEHLIAIFNDPKLTPQEKFQKITDLIGGYAASLEHGIESAMPAIEQAIEAATPRIAELAGKLGIAAFKGVVAGFWNSDFLGKAIIGAFIAKKLGLFRAAGSLLGKNVGFGAVPSFTQAGTEAGTAFSVAAREAMQIGAAIPAPVPIPGRVPPAGERTSPGGVILPAGGAAARGAETTALEGAAAGATGAGIGAKIVASLKGAIASRAGALRSIGAGAGALIATGLTFKLIDDVSKGKGVVDAAKGLADKILPGHQTGEQPIKPLGPNPIFVPGANASLKDLTLHYEDLRKALAAGKITADAYRVALARVKPQLQATGRFEGFHIAEAIAKDHQATKGELARMKQTLDSLPPAAAKSASDAIQQMTAALIRQGELPPGAMKRVMDAIKGKTDAGMRSVTASAGRGGTQLVRTFALSFGSVLDVVSQSTVGLVSGLNDALKVLGVKPVKLTAGRLAKGLFGAAVTGVQLLAGGQARGGIIPGAGLKDTVPMAVPPGTVFVNRHQQPFVNVAEKVKRMFGGGGKVPVVAAPGERLVPPKDVPGLQRAMARSAVAGAQPYGSLQEMFGKVTRPHWMSHGGIAGFARGGGPGGPGSQTVGFYPAPGTNYSVGQEPQLAKRLGQLARALHLHLIGVSGFRTPQHSIEVGGFGDDPHTRGEASDTPGVESVSEGSLERFGLTRPFPGAREADHIQLLGGGKGAKGVSQKSAGGKASPAQRLPTIRVGGPKGALRDLAQAAGAKVSAAAQSFLDQHQGAGAGAAPAGKVPGNVRGWLTQALKLTGHFTLPNLAALTGRTLQESGGNPKAINLWDSNAKAGKPSKGLLQTIQSTFDAFKLPGLGDIWSPVANAAAAIRYMFSQYGHIVGPSGSGYARGGIVGGALARVAGIAKQIRTSTFAPGGEVAAYDPSKQGGLSPQALKQFQKDFPSTKPKAPKAPIWSGGKQYTPEQLKAFRNAHKGKTPGQLLSEQRAATRKQQAAQKKARHKATTQRHHYDQRAVTDIVAEIAPGIAPPDLFGLSGYDRLLTGLEQKYSALDSFFGRAPLADVIFSRDDAGLPTRAGHNFLDIGVQDLADLTVAKQRTDQLDEQLQYAHPARDAIRQAAAKIKALLPQVAALIKRRNEWVQHLRGLLHAVKALRTEHGKRKPDKGRLHDLKVEARQHARGMGLDPGHEFSRQGRDLLDDSFYLKTLEPRLQTKLDHFGGSGSNPLVNARDQLLQQQDSLIGTPVGKTGDPILDAIGGGVGGQLAGWLDRIGSNEQEKSTLSHDGLRAQLQGQAPAKTGIDQAAIADLTRQQLEIANKTIALQNLNLGTFRGFLSEFARPGGFALGGMAGIAPHELQIELPEIAAPKVLGRFAHGTMRIPETGLYELHRSETMIVPDAKGPFGSQLSGHPAVAGKERPVDVSITLKSDVDSFVQVVDARIDGYGARVVDQKIGRRSRQISFAPGPGRR